MAKHGTWAWENGETVTYNRWDTVRNQPSNNVGEDGAGICPDGMHDFQVNDLLHFICEI